MPSRNSIVLSLLLGLGICVADSLALAAEVIDLARFREEQAATPQKKCGIILKSKVTSEGAKLVEAEPIQAELYQFVHPTPPRVSPEEFLADFGNFAVTDTRRYFYYGGYGKPPFSKYDMGRWLSEAMVPDAEALYVLEVKPKWAMRSRSFRKVSLDITQLRAISEPVRYTKLQVSPLIKVLALAIHHTRMMESNINNQIYLAETLTYEPLLRAASFKMGAMEFIDLWHPQNIHEEQFKWFLKDLVQRYLEQRPSPAMEQQLKNAIRAKLEATYKNSPY